MLRAFAALIVTAALPAHAGKPLDAAKARCQLLYGVNIGLAGFRRFFAG